MDTITSHEDEGTLRLPGERRHPRVVGAVLAVVALVVLARVLDVVRNAPAESGRYGQMVLTVPDPYRLPVIACVVLLGALITAVVMLTIGRPANRTAAVILGACLAVAFFAGTLGQSMEAFSGGVGCEPLTRDQVRAAWADRPTVGEVLTGGVLQGNVADDIFVSGMLDRDPATGGCAGFEP